jgi:hypothetical protein
MGRFQTLGSDSAAGMIVEQAGLSDPRLSASAATPEVASRPPSRQSEKSGYDVPGSYLSLCGDYKQGV